MIGNQTKDAESQGREAAGRLVHRSRRERRQLNWGVEHIFPELQLHSKPNLDYVEGVFEADFSRLLFDALSGQPAGNNFVASA